MKSRLNRVFKITVIFTIQLERPNTVETTHNNSKKDTIWERLTLIMKKEEKLLYKSHVEYLFSDFLYTCTVGSKVTAYLCAEASRRAYSI